MNIFVLDPDPKIAAQMHLNKHVIKMILESAQMICTTHHLHPNLDVSSYNIPYKKTHMNHPCTKWVRSSLSNYKWLMELTSELNTEYRYRYDKDVNHKSWDAIKDLPLPALDDIGFTEWARAMPDECKIDNNPILSYRKYYIIFKKDFAKWKNRDVPNWFTISDDSSKHPQLMLI